MINLLLVGAGGKWAQKYIEIISKLDVLLLTANRNNWQSMINAGIDGVIISTPPTTHIEIATFALKQSIPTMIEKPLCLSLEEAKQLSDFTAPILVNHIHLFSKRYQEIKESISGKQIRSIDSVGYNKGPQRSYSSLWDYGPHDIAMLIDIMGKSPDTIKCKEFKYQIGSLFDIELSFDNIKTNSIIGNAGDAKRRMLNVKTDTYSFGYSDRDHFNDNPLKNAISVFINAINGKDDKRLGIDLALKVLEVIERCEKLCNSTQN